MLNLEQSSSTSIDQSTTNVISRNLTIKFSNKTQFDT